MSEFFDRLGERAYIIAEAGVNHLGSLELGERLIRGAKESGADAIKFQTYKAEKLTTKDAPRFWDWDGECEGSQYDSYSLLDSFGYKEHKKLKELCDKYGIDFLSTAFDNEAVDYLDKLGMKAFKIASCDLTNHPLLKYIAKKGKPILLSTGGSTINEIHEAVDIIEPINKEIVIMHCTLCYPTKNKDANINAISHLKNEFPYLIGLSDHTLGILTPVIARTLGAVLIEKHYTVDKTLGKSADHCISVDTDELKKLIEQVRICETLLGGKKQVADCEVRARKYARRSIVLAKNLSKGRILREKDLIFKRPGTGISPSLLDGVIGKKINTDITKDSILAWSMLESDRKYINTIRIPYED